MKKSHFFVYLCILFPYILPAHAATQSHSSLKNAVTEFLQAETQNIENAEITVRDLDRRLKLHECSSPLKAFWPMTNKRIGSTTVGIRCDGDKPWKIYLGAYIHIYKYVWVSKTGLNRNQLIDLTSINKEKRDITRLSAGYLSATTPIVGLQVKRNIIANQVLTNSMLDSQKMVKRGDRVTIISKHGGIEVRAAGVALDDGGKGERIRVKNIRSKREIEAFVSGQQRVLVAL